MNKTVLILAALFVTCGANARGHSSHRNPAEVRAFKHEHVCPSTGAYGGRCPGYVVDHIKPLCKGGADAPSNMQFQTVEAGKAKDKWECR
jgi:hypothetical protein